MNTTRVTSLTVLILNMYLMHFILCISAVIVALSFLEQGNCNGLGQGKQGYYGCFAAECTVRKSSLICHLLQCMHPVGESMAKGCKTARLPGSVLIWQVADRCSHGLLMWLTTAPLLMLAGHVADCCSRWLLTWLTAAHVGCSRG